MLDYFKIGLILAILGAFCYVLWDYQAVKEENTRLVNELTTANKTITALDNLVKANREIQKKTDGLIDQIDKESETHDADTSALLFDAIKRLH
jgi:hypothetical protein